MTTQTGHNVQVPAAELQEGDVIVVGGYERYVVEAHLVTPEPNPYFGLEHDGPEPKPQVMVTYQGGTTMVDADLVYTQYRYEEA